MAARCWEGRSALPHGRGRETQRNTLAPAATTTAAAAAAAAVAAAVAAVAAAAQHGAMEHVEQLVGDGKALAAVAVAAFFTVNVMAYHRERRRERKRREEEAKRPRKQFRLEVGSDEGWEFKTGFGKDGDFLGNGIGRSWWLAGQEDQVDPDLPFDREANPNTADRVYRKAMEKRHPDDTTIKAVIDPNLSPADQAAAAALKGSAYYARLQTDQGYWPGDYGGPSFMTPGLAIAARVVNLDFGKARRAAMLRYVLNHQHAATGGWGTHIEGHATAFGTALNYTAARLLGLERDDERAVKARDFLKSLGGAVAAPQWAKFWLAILGVYDWRGVNPTPPEMWLLPYWFPFMPARMWCHCRQVYLPMSALFGTRFVYPQAEADPLIAELREDLYVEKYENIRWHAFDVRENVAEIDIYNRQSKLMTIANSFMYHTIENPVVRALFHWPLAWLRRRANDFAFECIHMEDKHTNWIDIGPVNKAFHVVATFAKFGPDSPAFTNHLPRILDYLWLAEDGMKMQGYNGSMLWDTCFATHALAQALMASKAQREEGTSPKVDYSLVLKSLKNAFTFVDEMQVREDVEKKERFFRDKSEGGWPFSTRDHGWPISDCTGEGIRAALLIPTLDLGTKIEPISQERMEQAVLIILNLQNTKTDYGWASYELNRGFTWYEYFNPAQVFGDIMIDYSYVECTSAAVQALCDFARFYPDSALTPRSLEAAKTGAYFIIDKQRPSGGWYGSWAVCFTYAAWFGAEAMSAVLHTIPDLSDKDKTAFRESVLKSGHFLLGHQNEDGGWGESVKACAKVDWVDHPEGSQGVQTAWSILALVRAVEILEEFDVNLDDAALFETAAARGCELLRERQLPSGDWDQECITGVFNKSCAITYTAYRNIFPIWALARYSLLVNTRATERR